MQKRRHRAMPGRCPAMHIGGVRTLVGVHDITTDPPDRPHGTAGANRAPGSAGTIDEEIDLLAHRSVRNRLVGISRNVTEGMRRRSVVHESFCGAREWHFLRDPHAFKHRAGHAIQQVREFLLRADELAPRHNVDSLAGHLHQSRPLVHAQWR